jgi:ABC-type antimicrobial peptide transport system permease subunit
MDALVPSLVVFLAVVVAVLAMAARSPALLKLALSFFLKKKRLTALTVAGLIVGSAMVTGSLAVGDSMKHGVVEQVYANLGAVDEVIHSDGLFNEMIFDSVSADPSVAAATDGLAPLLILGGSVRQGASGPVESSVNIVGYNGLFYSFGNFQTLDGGSLTPEVAPGEAIINQKLADALDASAGSSLRITTRSPEFSVESIYSNLAQQVSIDLSVLMVVKDGGMGRFSLSSGGTIAQNVFANLSYLQHAIGAPSYINTIVVSNIGDDREGVKTSGDATSRLQIAIDEAVGFRDLRFNIIASSYVRIENENVFFDERYVDAVGAMIGSVAGMENVSALTSYFVNNISFGAVSIPYSTVTGLNPHADYAFGAFTDNITKSPIIGGIGDDEIIITNYTAARLGAGVGDSVSLNYSVYTSTFRQVYRNVTFTVKHVADLTGMALDPDIMPPFPGIRGKASCADWDPTWVSGDEMRSQMSYEDLDYWLLYGGTPKAYITLDKAKQLWANDLGDITTIKVKGTNLPQLASDIGSRLNSTILGGDAGISVLPVKANGIESAEGVQLLTETFLSFGVVVMISGIILAVALVGMVMEGRKREIGVLKTLGMKRGQVTTTFAFEAFFVSLISAAVGILVGLLIAFLCIFLTNTFWSNIVEGTTVTLYFTMATIVLGFVAGFLVSFIAFVLSAYQTSAHLLAAAFLDNVSRKKIRGLASTFIFLGVEAMALGLMFSEDASTQAAFILAGAALLLLSLPFLTANKRWRAYIVPVTSIILIATTVVYSYATANASESVPFALYFVSGFAIIAALINMIYVSLRGIASVLSRVFAALGANGGTLRIAFLSPARRAGKTCLAVSLFAVVIFTYLGLSVNIQGQQANIDNMVIRQGAGYDVMGESSISLRFDLGNETDRASNGLAIFPANSSVVQFLTYGQIGGSCSNLKKNLPPRLIGANESFTRDSLLRFQAPAHAMWSIWNSLDYVMADGAIPAIGDSNTVVWILGKGVGDHITMTDERGNEVQLVIVGITENSIFPGSVFISEDNINRLYPTTAEYRLFLFKTPDPPAMVSYLESRMQAYGMDGTLVEDLARGNLSVEWSYMGLFQALLLLGLLVGIFGLAVSSARAVEERKAEIGILRAIGFGRSMVMNSLLLESVYIATLGAIIGIVAGLLTSFLFFGRGTLLSNNAAIPWLAMLIVIVVVDLTALLAAVLPANRAARMRPVDALRKEQ